MKKPLLAFVFLGALVLAAARSFADEAIPPIPSFSAQDRVLIFAPHPDDETVGAGGVIQKALQANAKVKIAYLTNGDHNELAFIVYERRLTLRRGEFLHMGEVRRREAVEAMKFLGLSEKDLVFLGYPDFGTMEILTKYWGNTKPFKSILTRITKVPYPDSLSPGAPYVGESMLSDVKKVLLDFRPTKVFVTQPVDTNRDHRAAYLFVQIALWDLEGQIPKPEVYPYLVHVVGWPKPRGYHPELELLPSKKITDHQISWLRLDLNDGEIAKKHDTIAFYKSQIEYAPAYLFTFARKNELFSDYQPINLKKQKTLEDIEWPLLWDTRDPAQMEEDDNISDLSYALEDDSLFIKLILRRSIDKDLGISVVLLGYSRAQSFDTMPKIHLSVDLSGMHVKNKKTTIFVKDAKLRYKGNAVIINVPLSLLSDPDYVLSSASTLTRDLPFKETAWRIIKLK